MMGFQRPAPSKGCMGFVVNVPDPKRLGVWAGPPRLPMKASRAQDSLTTHASLISAVPGGMASTSSLSVRDARAGPTSAIAIRAHTSAGLMSTECRADLASRRLCAGVTEIFYNK